MTTAPSPSKSSSTVNSEAYEAVVGLEVHVQLKTRTGMFCGCANEFGGAPNTRTCPICLGLPGALPAPNQEAIIQTILTGLMFDCKIATVCHFDRKNYFYPDMPKNYQISQYDEPLCLEGAVPLHLLAFPKDAQNDPAVQAAADKKVRLTRIHLEEDVGKSFHFESATGIDFNRAGTPLMEIVSEPDIAGPEEAFAYLTSLRQHLLYAGVSDADMEKGQMRCDVNVSVRKRGAKEFGTKVEIKNMNSTSAVRRALRYEIDRQIQALEAGETIRQETRRWSDPDDQTFVMRLKEKAHDYRYFPDPDLQPIRTDRGLLEEARKRMPERPAEKRARLAQAFGVSIYQAAVLADDLPLAAYFERAAKATQHGALAANFLLNDYLAMAPDTAAIPVPPEYFAQLAEFVGTGKINSRQAKEVFAAMIAEGKAPEAIVAEKGLAQVNDAGALDAWCDEAIAANPKSVADFKAGKQNAVNALKGTVMKLSGGKANPAAVGEILVRKLSA